MGEQNFHDEISRFFEELNAFEAKVKDDLETKTAAQRQPQQPVPSVPKEQPEADLPEEPKLSYADQWFAETKTVDWSQYFYQQSQEPVAPQQAVYAPPQSQAAPQQSVYTAPYNNVAPQQPVYPAPQETVVPQQPSYGNPQEPVAPQQPSYGAPQQPKYFTQPPMPAEPTVSPDQMSFEMEKTLPVNTPSTEVVPEEEDTPKRKKEKKPWSTKKKVLLCIICFLLALLIAGAGFLWSKLNLLHTGGEDWEAVNVQENDIDAATINSITDAKSLTDLLKAWETNGGDHMHSKYVKNILLLGVDSDSQLSDTMMLVSINRKTQQVSMVSFYRDSYTYIEREDKPEGSFSKLNMAYNYGGAELVTKTIENNYKIDIDEYMVVDYNSFPKVIDGLGGVTVNVTEKEANYLNETWWRWTRTKKKIQFNSGDMKMDGEHALMYCRIRKLDSDIYRTERQRKVLLALMNQFTTASPNQINNGVNVLFPYVTTSMNKGTIISYGTQALTEGWLGWNRIQATMPTEECCREGYAGTQWIWICDYEGAAKALQIQLYGQSNIQLADNRVSALSFTKDMTATSVTTRATSAAATGVNQQTTRAGGNATTRPVTHQASTAFGDDLVANPNDIVEEANGN